MNRKLRIVLIGFVGVGVLWWIAAKVDLTETMETLSTTSPLAVAGTLAIVYLTIPLRALQWQWLLGSRVRVKFSSALKAICIGHLGNFLLPARGGELVRTYLLARLSSLSVSRILPSVFLSRVQDLPAIFGLVVLVLALAPNLSFDLEAGSSSEPTGISLGVLAGRLMIVLLATAALIALAYALRTHTFTLLTRLRPDLFARAERVRHDLSEGMEIVGSWRYFGGSLALSLNCWALFAIAPVPLLMSFGFSPGQSLLIGTVQTAVTSLTFVLPSTPGAIGTFHALCYASVYAVAPETDSSVVLAYTVVAHLIGTLGPGVPGLLVAPLELRRIRASWNQARAFGSRTSSAD